MRISNGELRMLSNAINWSLNVPFDRTPQPSISELDTEYLEKILQYLHMVINGSEDVFFEENWLRSETRKIQIDSHIINAMAQCVSAFYSEIGHSSEEIEAITGVPTEYLYSLRDRLSKLAGSH